MSSSGSKYVKPYLDACVWISGMDPEQEFHQEAANILRLAQEQVLKIVMSTLMPLEVLVKADEMSPEERKIRQAIQSSMVLQVAPDPLVVGTALELRRTRKLHSMDALHVATAIYAGADAFITSDTDLLKQCRDEVRVPVVDLKSAIPDVTLPFPAQDSPNA